jgi:hypothetical protein
MVLESETIIMKMMMMNLYCENPCKKKKKILYEFWYDVDVRRNIRTRARNRFRCQFRMAA